MPIYEYECKHCGEIFEHLTYNTKLEVCGCPVCNTESKRIISSFSFDVRGFNAANNYSKDHAKTSDIIKNGPIKSIQQSKRTF